MIGLFNERLICLSDSWLISVSFFIVNVGFEGGVCGVMWIKREGEVSALATEEDSEFIETCGVTKRSRGPKVSTMKSWVPSS